MKPFVIILFFTLTFVVSNCVDQCGNPEVEEFFNTHLRNIETQFHRTEIVSGQSMLSILTLQKVTGIESSVQFGDTSVYNSSKDMELDKYKWMLWLDNNICQVSVDNLEAIEQDIRIKHPYFTGVTQ